MTIAVGWHAAVRGKKQRDQDKRQDGTDETEDVFDNRRWGSLMSLRLLENVQKQGVKKEVAMDYVLNVLDQWLSTFLMP